ncbi:hypothetical protein HNP38_001334 [Chryseobacterium defluvii]|uniref:Uncharacterized protein n=1 Tax=Chryseobacterium defluvii TaxID=160396 RepID=A0A840KGL5_9FLAO|nr:hypothetical protein [Chryseobacterium defluvii]MBB4806062.1 hypothetical protein [Chryseobacterium defluvii]
MNTSFFKKIGLYDFLNIETEMSKPELIQKLKKMSYESSLDIFSVADYAIPNRFEYKGLINENNFILRRRKHFFDSKNPNPNITGIIDEKNGKTFIKTEFMPAKYLVLIHILLSLLFLAISFAVNETGIKIFILVMLLIVNSSHYFAMKTAIKKNKYDFERELNYIIQKNNYFKGYQ